MVNFSAEVELELPVTTIRMLDIIATDKGIDIGTLARDYILKQCQEDLKEVKIHELGKPDTRIEERDVSTETS